MPENHWALMVLNLEEFGDEWFVRFDRIESFVSAGNGTLIKMFSGEERVVRQSVKAVQDMMIECSRKVNAHA